MDMVARYGWDKRLPEALTAEIFKNAPPELTAQASPEVLGRTAFMAMYLVDANAHLNRGLIEAEGREQVIRRWAENMLRSAIERDLT